MGAQRKLDAIQLLEGISLPGDIVDTKGNVVLFPEGTKLTEATIAQLKSLGISPEHIDLDNSPRLPRHIIHTHTGGIIIPRGVRETMAARHLQTKRISADHIDFHAEEPLDPSILQSIAPFQEALERVFQTTDVAQVQEQSLCAVELTLKKLFSSRRFFIGEKQFQSDWESIKHASKSAEHLGGHIGTNWLRARGESKLIEHGAATMIGTTNFLKYLRDNVGTSDVYTSLSEVVSGGVSGLFHDSGMSVLPERILHPNSPLSEQELKLSQFHPLYGALLLSQNNKYDSLEARITRDHHKENAAHNFSTKEERTIINAMQIEDLYNNLLDQGKCKAEAIMIMNKKQASLGKLYPHFYQMITRQDVPALFTGESRIAIDPRDLRNEVFSKLRLPTEGKHQYVAVVLRDSNRTDVRCCILDLQQGKTTKEQIVAKMSDVTLDFHSMIILAKKK